MATTTPNYGWTVPTSTDLVKDGATAIETLGDAIDASMNTALGTKKAGMVLLNTTSFSGVASQSINDVFSATYDNYRIILDVTDLTADGDVFAKLRVGGVDSSASYYSAGYGWLTSGAQTSINISNDSRGFYMFSQDAGTDNIYGFVGDILKPFLAISTKFSGLGNGSTATGVTAFLPVGGNHQVATSYTSLNLIASSGNMTGSISVYGYNK
jgi:hypothetical protein